MTEIAARRTGLLHRTGGPSDDERLMEHILGWALVIVIAMFTAQLGLF
ncbi:SCO1431 family membrane protein [Streptomyces sp. NPDC005336]